MLNRHVILTFWCKCSDCVQTILPVSHGTFYEFVTAVCLHLFFRMHIMFHETTHFAYSQLLLNLFFSSKWQSMVFTWRLNFFKTLNLLTESKVHFDGFKIFCQHFRKELHQKQPRHIHSLLWMCIISDVSGTLVKQLLINLCPFFGTAE